MKTFKQFLLEGKQILRKNEFLIIVNPNTKDFQTLKNWRDEMFLSGESPDDFRFNYTPKTPLLSGVKELMVIWCGYLDHSAIYHHVSEIKYYEGISVEGLFDTKNIHAWMAEHHSGVTLFMDDIKKYFRKLGLKFK